MRIEARVAVSGSAKRIMQRKASDHARHLAEDVGREMVKIANKKMAEQFNLNRPAGRRRYPGSVRASNALDYQVDGSELPISVRYRVRGGDEVVGRIIYMNYGTRGHDIPATGAWGGKGTTAIPSTTRKRISGGKLAWFEDGYWTVQDSPVGHPGQNATFFLQEAAEEALAKFAR